MGRNSGGVRGGRSTKIVPFRESEKAIQVMVRYEAVVAPSSGFTSSMVREINSSTKVWIPKSMIENGNISEYANKLKTKEIEDSIKNRYLGDPYIVRLDVGYFDAKDKLVKVAKNKKERQWQKERDKQREQNFAKANQRREELVKKAKENGFTAHMKMKTSTLEKMANGTYVQKKRKR